jgi:hypothetical protein
LKLITLQLPFLMKKTYPLFAKTWLPFCLSTAFATVFSLNLNAQNGPVKQWDKTFGGSNYDALKSLQPTADGGYILGGYSNSGLSGDKNQASKGGYDCWVVKVDANGNKTWDKTIGGSGGDELASLLQTSDGGFMLGGSSDSNISGDKSQANKGLADYWVVKLDANGNKQWDKTIGGIDLDALKCIKQTSDGGYILGGWSNSGISGDKSHPNKGNNNYYDYWVVKLDANGNIIWDKTFGGSLDDNLQDLQQTSDGGYILGGYSQSGISVDKSQNSKGGSDYWVVKLDANGTKVWDKTIGGNYWEILASLYQTSDGGYILGGSSDSDINGDKSQPSIAGTFDYWVVKIDASGNIAWDKTMGGNSHEGLSSLQQTSDGGYIMGGISNSDISGDKSQANTGTNSAYDFWVLKLDANGTRTWDKTIGGEYADAFCSLKQTSDGAYILGGYSESGISGDKSQACQGNFDYWMVKLGADVLGLEESETSPDFSIFPNPNQGKFNLQFSNLAAPKAQVTICNLLGKVVLQKEIQTTNNQLSEELILPNSKGIYLVQLKAGEQILTRKIVVE